MQVSKRFPLLSPLSFLFAPPKIIRLVPKFFKMNSQEVQRRIDNRGKTTHPDFVDYMLPTNAPAPTKKKEKVHLEQVSMQLLIAGFDPIQITFFSSLFFLLKNQDAYKTLVEEIRNTFRNYTKITPDNLASLKYLNAVIHETLRTHVTAITGLPRKSPGAMVAGTYVPRGVSLVYPLIGCCLNYRFYDAMINIFERWYARPVTSIFVATPDISMNRLTSTRNVGFSQTIPSTIRDFPMTTLIAFTPFL